MSIAYSHFTLFLVFCDRETSRWRRARMIDVNIMASLLDFRASCPITYIVRRMKKWHFALIYSQNVALVVAGVAGGVPEKIWYHVGKKYNMVSVPLTVPPTP